MSTSAGYERETSIAKRAEVFEGEGLRERWRFRLVAGNGEIVAQSEGYFSKWNAKRAARRFGVPVVEVSG